MATQWNSPSIVAQAGTRLEDETPSLLIQPRPIGLAIARLNLPGGGHVTGILRTWAPGDAPRCRLCPRALCVVNGNQTCMVLFSEYVPDELAPLAPFLASGLEGTPGAWVALGADSG